MKPELFNSIKTYKAKYLLNDFMAAIIVTIVAIPLSMALGIDSGATLQQGLMTAIVASFFLSLTSGTRFQIGGPTAAFAVIIAGYIADPQIGYFGVQLIMLGAGVLLIIAGFLKLGKYIKFVPYPIIVGYTTSVGVMLLVGQLKNFLGVTTQEGFQFNSFSSFINRLADIIGNISTFSFPTFLIGMLTILLIVFIPKLTKKIPSSFVAIIVVTLINLAIQAGTGKDFGIQTLGTRYGDIKAEFGIINFGAIKSVNLAKLIIPAFVIAFLCAMESLLTALVVDNMTSTKHNSDQELKGQGITNIACSVFCALPATGALARTSANVANDAKSPLSGIFHSIILLLCYVLFLPAVKFIPLASLGAVLIVVAINMSSFKLFFRLTTFTFKDTVVLMIIFWVTVIMDLAYGIILGLTATLLFNIPNLIKPAKLVQKSAQEVSNSNKYIEENIKFFYVTNNISFNSIAKIVDTIMTESKDCDLIVLDMSGTKSIDATSVERLSKCSKSLAIMDKRLVLHNANENIKNKYKKAFRYIIRRW